MIAHAKQYVRGGHIAPQRHDQVVRLAGLRAAFCQFHSVNSFSPLSRPATSPLEAAVERR